MEPDPADIRRSTAIRTHSHRNERVLFPIVKLGEYMTYEPWEEIACSGVVIKAQDLLSCDGKRFNTLYESIRNADGIHPFLDYNGQVILSTIMPDRMIAGFPVNAYAKMIEDIQPDFFLTPDGETYYKEEERSAREIERLLSETYYLLEKCPDTTPIGLVKGCNKNQIEYHTNYLSEFGISRFAFHASDFLWRGQAQMTDQAVDFTSIIRKRVPWLLIYGVCAPRSIQRFHFADGYITQSHFVNAFYGRFCNGVRKATPRKVTRRDIMDNLRKIHQNVISIQYQTEISRWFEPNTNGSAFTTGVVVEQMSV